MESFDGLGFARLILLKKKKREERLYTHIHLSHLKSDPNTQKRVEFILGLPKYSKACVPIWEGGRGTRVSLVHPIMKLI